MKSPQVVNRPLWPSVMGEFHSKFAAKAEKLPLTGRSSDPDDRPCADAGTKTLHGTGVFSRLVKLQACGCWHGLFGMNSLRCFDIVPTSFAGL
jgi:hypothetical protein